MNIESAEQLQPEKEERSPEEIERINDSKERFQLLVDRATTTVNMALENKFIPELAGARLYKFLENIAEEANDVDKSGKSTEEIVAYLEELGDKVKLPGDIERENAEELLKKLEEMEQQKANRKATKDIDAQIQNRKQKKRGSFLRM